VHKEAENWLAAEQAEGLALPTRLEYGSVMAAARSHGAMLLVLPAPIASAWSRDSSALATDAPCTLVIAR
jgi:hypothetical protein